MPEAAWRSRVIDYIRAEAQPVDKFGHQPRLYALASQLGQGLLYDDDILFAAAWMHDLGVFLGHRPQDPEELKRWNHVPYTMARTQELLGQWGFPAEKLAYVAEAIRTHQPMDEPVLLEAVLLRDADILEQLGGVGILRAVAKIGRDTRYEIFSQVTPVLEKALRELPGKLHTERAKALAAPRIDTLSAFLTSLKQEAGELLY